MTREELLREIVSVQVEAKHAMFSHFQRAFADTGLSPAPLQLLMTMTQCSRVTSKSLADKLHLTAGAVSQLIDGLEQTGFISREQDKLDRRVTHLSLSEAGKQKMLGLQKKRDQIFAKAMSALNDDELKTFLKAQQSMLAYFKAENEKSDSIKKKVEK